MKPKYFIFFLAVAMAISVQAQPRKEVNIQRLPDHPRLLLLKGEEAAIREAIAKNGIWKKMHAAIIAESDRIIGLPVLERIQIGRRLLDKSRECIRRILHLAYAYRMTQDDKYLRRADKEMLTIARFSDWNPSHFLDVAEMTLGMSIGVDWLHDALSKDSRVLIREAIVNKGLKPSLEEEYNGWLRSTHNWNQVCNAGMTFGALAVASEYPALAKQIIDRASNTISTPMEEYKPDGAYPEGYGYWGYGTSFNILLIDAIDKALGSDFGLADIPGFLQTAAFRLHMIGATGLPFNWGDAGTSGGLSPAMFWFAEKNNDPSLLWMERKYLEGADFSRFSRDRLLPAIMIWGKNIDFDKITPPEDKFWVGQGANPVCMMRTSWQDPNALYLGFKAGSPSVNHGHMDIGSFIFESDGVRWAADFGMQDYESLESKGIRLFGRTQDAQRWTVFRLNNFVHNTLSVNNQLQRVDGYAKIDRFSDAPGFSYAISDLSAVYEDQLAAIKRGVAMVDGKYAVVQDEITAADTITIVRWTMLTPAQVNITGKNTASLVQDGKRLILKVTNPATASLKTWSTEPTTEYDAPNPGTTLVGFEVQLPPGKEAVLRVMLLPEGTEESKEQVRALRNWD